MGELKRDLYCKIREFCGKTQAAAQGAYRGARRMTAGEESAPVPAPIPEPQSVEAPIPEQQSVEDIYHDPEVMESTMESQTPSDIDTFSFRDAEVADPADVMMAEQIAEFSQNAH